MESQNVNEELWSRFLNRWDGEGARPLGDSASFEPLEGYQHRPSSHDPPSEGYSARVRRINAERDLVQPAQYFQDRYHHPSPDQYRHYCPERATWHPAAGGDERREANHPRAAQPRLPERPKPRRVASEYLGLERPSYDRTMKFDTEFDNGPYNQQRLTRGLLDNLDSNTSRPGGVTQRGYIDRPEQPGGPSGCVHPQASSSHHWPGQFVHGDQGLPSPTVPSPYVVARAAVKGEPGLLPLPHSGFDSRSDVNAMRERGPMRDVSRSGPSSDSRIDSRGVPVTRDGSSDPTSSSPGGHETKAQHDSQRPAKHLRNQTSPGGQPHHKAQRKTGDGAHGLAGTCEGKSHGMAVGNPVSSSQQGSNTAFEPYRKPRRPVHAAGAARNPHLPLGAKTLPDRRAFVGQQSLADDSSGSKKQGILRQRKQPGIATHNRTADDPQTLSKPSSKSSGERCSPPSDERMACNQSNHSGSNAGSNEPRDREAPEVTLRNEPRQGGQGKAKAALKLMIGTDPLVRSKRAGRRAAKAIAALEEAAVNPGPIDRMTQEDTRQHVRKSINLAVAAGKFALEEMHQMTGTSSPDGTNDEDDDDDHGEDDGTGRDE